METISYNRINEIAEKYGTPFYFMYPDVYKQNVNSFTNAFLRKYDKLIVGYSFKTNYVPALGKIAKEIGCYAEVVSEMEYDIAKCLGYEHIIFNGPIKNERTLIRAIEDGAIINLDSMYEVDSVCRYVERTKRQIQVGIRINIDLFDENGESKIQSGLRVGRFGFAKSVLAEAIQKLERCHIKIISIHGHTSSSDRAVDNYRLIVEQMLSVCEKYQLDDVKYFDVGGGFFGAAADGIDVSHKPKYEDYSTLILQIVLNSKWFSIIKPFIVIEPGVSVVANVFSYISKLYQHKYIAGTNFISTDGTVFDVKPTMHTNNLPYRIYMANEKSKCLKFDVVGSTCMEKDIILRQVDVPENVNYGDYLFIDGVGAYTIAMTPVFINYLSPIISIENGKIELVRRRQTVKDVMELYNY